jgi:phospholipase/carboxylesterase
MNRRAFLALAATAAVLPRATELLAAQDARLSARSTGPKERIAPGLHKLGLGEDRDGVLYVPKSYQPDKPMPLAIMLHGAGNRAQGMEYTHALGEEFGVILLVPDSRNPRTWDALLGAFGSDVQFIDAALAYTFARCAIDTKRLAVGGFSDGASYALSLGLGNGDVFSRIIAFSPGFIPPVTMRGKPRVFVSHGTQDQVLPIDDTSRRIVPGLKARGYDVTYREFEGPHRVPPTIARDGFEWFVRG